MTKIKPPRGWKQLSCQSKDTLKRK